MRTVVRYSEAFKRQVVSELERGKHPSFESARRAYGIRGSTTVSNWMRKYGDPRLFPKKVRVETLKERDELSEARKRIRELETALSDAHVRNSLGESYFRIACERLGVDPEDFKKKNAMTLSEALNRPRRGKS